MRNKNAYWSLLTVASVLSWTGWASIYWTLYSDAHFFWSVPIASFFFCLVLVGVYILVEKKMWSMHAFLAVLTVPSVLMMGRYWYYMVPVWLVAILVFGIGVEWIRSERDNRIRIVPHRLLRFGLPMMMTALSLLISADYYLSIKDKTEKSGVPQVKITLPKPVIYIGLDIVSSLMPEPNLRSIARGETVDEFLLATQNEEVMIDQQEVERYLASQGDQLTAAERDEIRRQAENFSQDNNTMVLALAREKLSGQLGMQLSGAESMKDVMAQFINRKIEYFFNGEGEKQELLPLGMAMALFLTLKAIAWILGFPLAWTTTGVFNIMVKMKWLTLEKVRKEVEEVV